VTQPNANLNILSNLAMATLMLFYFVQFVLSLILAFVHGSDQKLENRSRRSIDGKILISILLWTFLILAIILPVGLGFVVNSSMRDDAGLELTLFKLYSSTLIAFLTIEITIATSIMMSESKEDSSQFWVLLLVVSLVFDGMTLIYLGRVVAPKVISPGDLDSISATLIMVLAILSLGSSGFTVFCSQAHLSTLKGETKRTLDTLQPPLRVSEVTPVTTEMPPTTAPAPMEAPAPRAAPTPTVASAPIEAPAPTAAPAPAAAPAPTVAPDSATSEPASDKPAVPLAFETPTELNGPHNRQKEA
jgi:hypothetical protein